MAVRGKETWDFYYRVTSHFLATPTHMLSSESDEVDERDVKRVRVRPSYVKKFLIQKLGDEDAAYDMMVCHNLIYLLFFSFNLSWALHVHNVSNLQKLCVKL